MFCTQCGTELPGSARFCSSCGTSVASPSPAQVTPPVPSPAHGSPHNYTSPPDGSYPYSHVGGSSPGPTTSVLFSPQGYPQLAFKRLAAALFNALDQAYQPQGSGGMEVSKMTAYRTLGGLTIPPYYGEYVLPTYASVIGIELVPHRPQSAPVITWNGWHQFLTQKILFEPEASFLHLTRVLAILHVPIVLQRADFPNTPSPQAQAKEFQFRTAIYALAQRGLTAGAFGAGRGGGFGGGGFGGGGAGGGNGSGSTSAMATLAVNLMSNGMGGGAGL